MGGEQLVFKSCLHRVAEAHIRKGHLQQQASALWLQRPTFCGRLFSPSFYKPRHHTHPSRRVKGIYFLTGALAFLAAAAAAACFALASSSEDSSSLSSSSSSSSSEDSLGGISPGWGLGGAFALAAAAALAAFFSAFSCSRLFLGGLGFRSCSSSELPSSESSSESSSSFL